MGRYAIAVVVSVEQMACAVQNDQSLGGGADQKAPIAQMQQRAQIALKQQWNGRMAEELTNLGVAIVNGVKAAGYRFVTLDLAGFRSGSLNGASNGAGNGAVIPLEALL